MVPWNNKVGIDWLHHVGVGGWDPGIIWSEWTFKV